MKRSDNAEMFTRIAGTYDLLNHLLSANADVGWRRRAVRAAAPAPGSDILDLCSGTGDLALLAARVEPKARIVGADASPGMLARAARKAAAAKAGNLSFVLADAYDLPFPRASFDAVTMGFGLRNLSDPARGLAEAVRVARAGARIVVLEFVRPPASLFGRVFTLYLDRVLPLLGGAVSGHPGAYRFLARSIEEYRAPEELAALMRAAGCGEVETRLLFFGVAALFAAPVKS